MVSTRKSLSAYRCSCSDCYQSRPRVPRKRNLNSARAIIKVRRRRRSSLRGLPKAIPTWNNGKPGPGGFVRASFAEPNSCRCPRSARSSRSYIANASTKATRSRTSRSRACPASLSRETCTVPGKVRGLSPRYCVHTAISAAQIITGDFDQICKNDVPRWLAWGRLSSLTIWWDTVIGKMQDGSTACRKVSSCSFGTVFVPWIF